MSVKMRQEVERRIVERLVDDVLATGRRIAVSLERGYDTDECLLGSRDKKRIMEEAFAGDECHLFVQPPEGETLEGGKIVSEGWVYLVFGNEGWDVISDYTVNPETIAGAEAVAKEYQ